MAAATAAVLFGAIGTVGTASAAPAQRTVEVFTGTFTFDFPVVCGNGPSYTQTQNVTITDYVVTTSGQTLLDRSVLNITFTGVPDDPSLPTVSGTIKGDASFDLSPITAGETFHGLTTATYSDGTRVIANETDHFTISQPGLVTSFDRCVSG